MPSLEILKGVDMAKQNMNCAGQKANSKDFNDNYDRIFRKQFFDICDEIDEILEEANKVMRYCSVCEKKCGEMNDDDWEIFWNEICDECVSNETYKKEETNE